MSLNGVWPEKFNSDVLNERNQVIALGIGWL
jgi:hypothetical protein